MFFIKFRNFYPNPDTTRTIGIELPKKMLPYITQWLWNSEKSPEKEQEEGFEILDNQPFNKEDDWVLIEKSSPSESYTRMRYCTVYSCVSTFIENAILFVLLFMIRSRTHRFNHLTRLGRCIRLWRILDYHSTFLSDKE